MSTSPSSPPAPSRYTVVTDSGYTRAHIYDRVGGRVYFYGGGADGPRREYTVADAWAVCDWLNGRPQDVARVDHRDLVTA